MPSTVKVLPILRMLVLMRAALHAQEPRGQDPSPRPVSGVTHPWPSTTSTPKATKVRVQTNKLQRNRSQRLVKPQDSNDLVPTAPRRRPQTRPAASASSSQLPSNQAGHQLPHQVDRLLVKAERHQPALALHPSVLVPARKHPTQR
jgi:hypothetical protein